MGVDVGGGAHLVTLFQANNVNVNAAYADVFIK